ncbi:hypothetical protein ACTMTI_26655 [Nonomuraea sp. H19]|uniref:hypothetical protein n=1 Tax=Nonomuraea sp. H19 TaxID=3452206 RepID=UPI003F8AADD0
MKRILAMLVAAVAALAVGAVPAAGAGGWAVTYLDPLPSRFAGGSPYALGFWVLQHGNHPFEGDIGTVGLRFTREKDGKSLSFKGTALPEAGHYATSVVVPEGVWRVEGIQGLFRPHRVGTLEVPGALEIDPVPEEVIAGFEANGKDYWGAVRPPGFPVLKGGVVASDVGAAVATGPVAPSSSASASASPVAQGQVAQGRDSGGVPAYTLLIATAGGALLAVAALRWSALSRLPHPSRRKDDDQDPPVDASAETITISG